MSSSRPNRPVIAKPSASNQQPPLILPDNSLGRTPSNDLAGARSFVTQTWTIPDRPKPGRKPKQKATRPDSKQTAQRSDQSSSLFDDSSTNPLAKNRPPSVIEVDTEPITKAKGLETSVFPEALQQSYINSLEAKIESLQTQQSEQARYYKSLASQSTSKLNAIQSENDVLQSQVNVLRGEVLRLRKRISQLVKKSSPNTPSTSIVIEEEESNTKESKVRKQGSHPDLENASSLPEQSGNSLKKPRHEADHNEGNDPKSNALIDSKTQNPTKTLSEIYLLEDSRTLAETNNLSTKRVPDFTSSDIYCGLCTSELDCVCRQVGLKPPLGSIGPPGREHTQNLSAVPIRRRSQPSTTNIWRLVTEDDSGSPVEASPEIEPSLARECSGNPKDCPACRNDPFGQAFCAALNQANVAQESGSMGKVSTTGASSNTAKQFPQSDPVVDAYMSIPCCGDPELCGSQNCFESSPPKTGVKISCSEAWRQLKVHPNIGLANLQLLADVVARKSTPYPSSSTSIDSNHPSFGHPHHQSYRHLSSSQSIHENEDPSFSPHVTLSTVFANVHADLDDDQQVENAPFQNHYSRKDSLSDPLMNDPDMCNYQQNDPVLPLNTHINTSFNRRQVKFVEKESLDQALRMLDGASHRT